MMLTFGFFTQESVTTGIRFVNSSTTAMGSISTARSYRFEDSFPPRPWSGTMAFSYIQGGGTEADSLLSRALISGAVANHSLSDIPAECPTSRCEWKSYTTLAICSSVEDISSELLGSSTPPPGENYLNLSLPVPELYSGRTDSAGRDHLWMGSVGNLYNRSDGTFSGPVNMVAEVYYVYFPPCAATHNTPGNLSMEAWKSSQAVKENWKAVKGTFNLCLQELNTTAINGSTTTTVVRREDRSPWQIDTSLRNVFYPVDNPQNLEGRLDYSMERSTMLALAENIKQTVNGSANLIAGGDNYWESALDLALGQDIFGPDPLYCTLNSNTDIGGLENRLRNISVSLTNTLRRNANGNLAISGSAFSAEQYYIVKLWWLSLPTLAWLITTALVLVTMWSTHANNLPGWKSSALPLLICTEPKNGMTHGEALRREAKSRDIQLKEDGAAWHLDRTL
ncbi:hypothetical protein P152DRAFT_441359 [Eremomyces bilateralis CBS 781.70]|uniref:Uncharacterized protein n=1 Tax=Eremomyces bilateralis CBS 781.70 TaxID=1392243 RepID=A0A6G1FVN2_9PEZI|nr:uncharacterized protein P152DRAFT_441359 [Eremomyces bilateralis CBS 781.70]KAF1809844.1 hypothetical protein P152DRAFT_441359 [Eremomyces bilateralis CBS 781.70]